MYLIPDQISWQLCDVFYENEGETLFPVTSGYQTFAPGSRDEMLLSYNLICCVKEGACRYYDCPLSETENKEGILVTAGESFIIPAGKFVSYVACTETPWVNAWIGFSGSDSERYINSTPFAVSTVTKTGTDFYDDIRHLTDTIAKTDFPSVKRMLAISVLWKTFALLTDREPSATKSSSFSPYTEEALSIIHRTYNTFSRVEYMPTVSDIAKRISISREHFFAVFKADVGKSPSRYLLEYRIGKARELLMESRYPVYVIAQYLGFYDHAYFTKKFRQITGKSPSEYRKDR